MIPPMVETKLPNFTFPNWPLQILWDIEFLGIFWSRTGKILSFFDGIFYKGLESAKNFIKKTNYLFENHYLTIFWPGESIFDGLETISEQEIPLNVDWSWLKEFARNKIENVTRVP